MPVRAMENLAEPRPQARFLTTLLLLWLAGTGLRLTILAVPPVIPLIHDGLKLNATQIGILTGLPSMLFAFAAVPGSLLIARLGVRTALVVGLAVTAIGGALRGAMPDVMWLYAMTITMGAGVAVMQVTMPPAVRNWIPQRIGFATAVYTNGLLVGETLPVALTLPFVLPLVGSWRWSFVFWAVPVLLTALLFLYLAPADAKPSLAQRRNWWPDWKDPLVWRLALMLGCVNTIYFATNTFLPDYLHAVGGDRYIGPALTALNFCQLPASLLMLLVAERLVRRRLAYIVPALLVLASAVGMAAMPGRAIIGWAGLLGFANAAMLILMLALPSLLAAPEDVHRVSAAMFTISYPMAVALPILAGLLWDWSGLAAAAFAPAALCGIGILALAPTIDLHRREAASR